MYGFFVIIVVAMSVAAALFSSYWARIQTSDIADVVRRNASVMDQVASTMQALSDPVVPGGPVRAPAGRVAPAEAGRQAGRQVLPAETIGQDRTPWGAYYGWCPSATVAATGAERDLRVRTIAIGAGSTYDVVVVDGPYGDPMVVSGRPTSGDLPVALGYVISPANDSFDLPRCDEIAIRDGAYVIGLADRAPTVPGTVRAVFPESRSLVLRRQEDRATLYAAPAAAGRGDGSDASNPVDLPTAIRRWELSSSDVRVVSLAGGTYTLTGDLRIAPPGGIGRLVLAARETGVDGAGLPIVDASSPFDVEIAGDVEISGVAFGGDAGISVMEGSDVEIRGSRLSTLRVAGGRVEFVGPAIVSRPDGHPRRAVEITSGSVSFGGSLAIVDRQAGQDAGAVSVVGGTARFAGDVAAEVAVGGRPFVAYGSGTVLVDATPAGAPPKASWGGMSAPLVGRISSRSTECAGGYECQASCPPLTGPESGGCDTVGQAAGDAGPVLASSAPTATGWSCRWLDETVLRGSQQSGYSSVRRAPPINPVATATCVAGR